MERTVTAWTARTITSKSLPEIQWRYQWRHLIDGCPHERKFPVAFRRCGHWKIDSRTIVNTRADSGLRLRVWHVPWNMRGHVFRLLAGQQFPRIASDERSTRKPFSVKYWRSVLYIRTPIGVQLRQSRVQVGHNLCQVWRQIQPPGYPLANKCHL